MYENFVVMYYSKTIFGYLHFMIRRGRKFLIMCCNLSLYNADEILNLYIFLFRICFYRKYIRNNPLILKKTRNKSETLWRCFPLGCSFIFGNIHYVTYVTAFIMFSYDHSIIVYKKITSSVH